MSKMQEQVTPSCWCDQRYLMRHAVALLHLLNQHLYLLLITPGGRGSCQAVLKKMRHTVALLHLGIFLFLIEILIVLIISEIKIKLKIRIMSKAGTMGCPNVELVST